LDWPTWDGDDEPARTVYERAADIHVHQKAARGWGTRYLRAVADRPVHPDISSAVAI
jgi:hypothetical protein